MISETQPQGYVLVAVMTGLYAAALLVSAPGLIAKKRGLVRAGFGLMIAAFALNTWAIAGRWLASGRPPFQTLYETMVFYPWCVAVITFALIGLHRLWLLIPFSAGVSAAGLGYALYRPDVEIIALPPALQSGWFVPHVATYFVAYAGLFASFVLAAASLGEPYWRKRLGTAREKAAGLSLNRAAHQAAVFGIAALTLGLVMGAVWGKVAWGDYWSWDAKENWALITWLAYMIYLHLGFMKEWRERRAMWALVAAFAAVVFTYLGMSLLPTASGSLHTYQ